MECECTGYLSERRFLGIAYRNAAYTKKSALGGCFGSTLADLTQPTLESSCIARRFCV